MPSYSKNDIRNVTVVGHSGSGKTSLCEAFLHTTGTTNRMGSVADKTSHLDTDEEEKDRLCSIESHVLHVRHDGKLLNSPNARILKTITPGITQVIKSTPAT